MWGRRARMTGAAGAISDAITQGRDKDGDGRIDRRLEISSTDGIATASEWMLPGDSAIERLRWVIQRLGMGGSLVAVAYVGALLYRLSPIANLHLLVWIALVVILIFLAITHLNTLLTGKSWSLFSGFLILFGFGFGLILLAGWV